MSLPETLGVQTETTMTTTRPRTSELVGTRNIDISSPEIPPDTALDDARISSSSPSREHEETALNITVPPSSPVVHQSPGDLMQSNKRQPFRFYNIQVTCGRLFLLFVVEILLLVAAVLLGMFLSSRHSTNTISCGSTPTNLNAPTVSMLKAAKARGYLVCGAIDDQSCRPARDNDTTTEVDDLAVDLVRLSFVLDTLDRLHWRAHFYNESKTIQQCNAVASAIFGDDGHVVLKEFDIDGLVSALTTGQVDIAVAAVTYKIQYEVSKVRPPFGKKCAGQICFVVVHKSYGNAPQPSVHSGVTFSLPYDLNQGYLTFAGLPHYVECAESLNATGDFCSNLTICVEKKSYVHFVSVMEDLFPDDFSGIKHLPTLDGVCKSFNQGICNVLAGEQPDVIAARHILWQQGYTGDFNISQRLYSKQPISFLTREDDLEWTVFVHQILLNKLQKGPLSLFLQGRRYSRCYRKTTKEQNVKANVGSSGEIVQRASNFSRAPSTHKVNANPLAPVHYPPPGVPQARVSHEGSSNVSPVGHAPDAHHGPQLPALTGVLKTDELSATPRQAAQGNIMTSDVYIGGRSLVFNVFQAVFQVLGLYDDKKNRRSELEFPDVYIDRWSRPHFVPHQSRPVSDAFFVF